MDYEAYEYRRGNDWSVTCIVSNGDNITYVNIVHPDKANRELIGKFLDEAEIATLAQLVKAKEG